MGERKRIGLVFSYNENWIAGTYYILNIIHALKTLEENKKPSIIILSESEDNFNIVKKETKYPYLEHTIFPFEVTHYSFHERIINKISFYLAKKRFFKKEKNIPALDFVYPRPLYLISNNLKKVNWIPDFQEEYLPHFFSEDEVLRRKKFQKEIVANGDIVVLSSEDAKNDFVRLYPKAKAIPYILRFAVTHPDFSHEKIKDLKAKYCLSENYFFAPNQFWAHKNHIIVLKAVKYLKDKGVSVVVAMSGKEDDYRNEENFSELKKYILKSGIDENIRFLGFIPRTEQLCLFKNALAIIQPSLFEGWSTVVEDAKRINKFLILSNLKVHKEQIKENVTFFNPNDSVELANVMENTVAKMPSLKTTHYEKKIVKFGESFMELVDLASVEN